MGLDIRVPIGVLFSIFGLMLAIFGIFSNPALYAQHSLGININLIWGLVLLFFGLAMLLLVRIGKSSTRSMRDSEHAKQSPQH